MSLISKPKSYRSGSIFAILTLHALEPARVLTESIRSWPKTMLLTSRKIAISRLRLARIIAIVAFEQPTTFFPTHTTP